MISYNTGSCIQELSVSIKSELLIGEVELKAEPAEPHKAQTRSFVDAQEFRLYQHVQTSFPHLDKTQNYKRPCMKVTCFVSRRPRYFVWNVFLVIVSNFTATIFRAV